MHMHSNKHTLKFRYSANNRFSINNDEFLNQVTRFTQGSKRIECVYDYRNRRVEKAVYDGDTLRTRTRFIYRGYLQIAELDASTATESHPAILRKTYLWDPSESTATRILALTSYDATGNYEAELYYTHDAQKNTTALFGIQAGRRASYQYSAYGSLLHMDSDLATLNPFRFSSEYHDEDLDLIYYNYRYYNPTDGRWIHRDPIEEQGGVNLYRMVRNNVFQVDFLGLNEFSLSEILEKKDYIKFVIGVSGNVSCDAKIGGKALLSNVKTKVNQVYAKHIEGKHLQKIVVITNTPQHYQAVVVLEAHGPTHANEILTGVSTVIAHLGAIVTGFSFRAGLYPIAGISAAIALLGVAGTYIPDYIDMTWNIEGSYLIDVKAECKWDGICYPRVQASINRREDEYDITM